MAKILPLSPSQTKLPSGSSTGSTLRLSCPICHFYQFTTLIVPENSFAKLPEAYSGTVLSVKQYHQYLSSYYVIGTGQGTYSYTIQLNLNHPFLEEIGSERSRKSAQGPIRSYVQKTVL